MERIDCMAMLLKKFFIYYGMMITMAIIKLVYVAHIRNILEDIAETVEELYGEAAYEEERAYIQGERAFQN